MNKFQKVTGLSILTLTLLAPGWAGAEEMKDMKSMKMMADYSKVSVMMKDGMELVPLRSIAEPLGYRVQWSGAEQSVSLSYGQMMGDKMIDSKKMDDNMMSDKMMDKSMNDMTYMVKVTIGSNKLMVGMTDKMISFAPVIMNDMTYVTKDFIEMYLSSPMMSK